MKNNVDYENSYNKSVVKKEWQRAKWLKKYQDI